jgi:DNA-directed RNA polymerase subunit RPC12/RpoP
MAEVIDSYNCPHCGAPLKVQQGELIVVCEYCSSTVGMKANEKYYLAHSIIPARYDAKAIEASIRSWMKGGVHLPDDLASKSKILELRCTYLPFFVFDIKATTAFKGYLTRTGRSDKREDTLEKKYPWKILARRDSKFPTTEFKIPLSGKVPFNISQMLPGAKFLNAELDDVEAKELAKSQIETHQRALLKDIVDEITSDQTEVDFRSSEFVHAPVWYAIYEYKGQRYGIYLDACSGEVIRAQAPAPDTTIGGVFRGLKHAFLDE